MDKITEIKKFEKVKTAEAEAVETVEVEKVVEPVSNATNPIRKSDSQVLKNLSKFSHQDISKKFNINDLLR